MNPCIILSLPSSISFPHLFIVSICPQPIKHRSRIRFIDFPGIARWFALQCKDRPLSLLRIAEMRSIIVAIGTVVVSARVHSSSLGRYFVGSCLERCNRRARVHRHGDGGNVLTVLRQCCRALLHRSFGFNKKIQGSTRVRRRNGWTVWDEGGWVCAFLVVIDAVGAGLVVPAIAPAFQFSARHTRTRILRHTRRV